MQRGGSGGNCRGGIVNTIQTIRDLEGENARACLATTNFSRHLVHSFTANLAPSLSLPPSLSLAPFRWLYLREWEKGGFEAYLLPSSDGKWTHCLGGLVPREIRSIITLCYDYQRLPANKPNLYGVIANTKAEYRSTTEDIPTDTHVSRVTNSQRSKMQRQINLCLESSMKRLTNFLFYKR